MDIFIYGAGKVGQTLGKLWKTSGENITGCLCRTKEKSIKAASFIGCRPYWLGQDLKDILKQTNIIIISVPDNTIKSVVEKLSELNINFENKYIFHTSGLISKFVLKPLSLKGAFIGSIHPLFPFTNPASAQNKLKNAYFFYEGVKKSENKAKYLIKKISPNYYRIKSRNKATYHLGAVFSSNFISLLSMITLSLWEYINIDKKTAREACYKLMESAIENIHEKGPMAGLSGPLIREDILPLKEHINSAEKNFSEINQLYTQITWLTAKYLYKNKMIKEDFYSKVTELLI